MALVTKDLVSKEYFDEQIKQVGVGMSQLTMIPYYTIADTEGQTTFAINVDIFDAEYDTILVQSGITMLFPDVDYVIDGDNIVLSEGVPVGRLIGVYVLKNVVRSDSEGAVSGTVLMPGTIPLDRLETLPEVNVTSDIPMHLSVNASGGLVIEYDDETTTE